MSNPPPHRSHKRQKSSLSNVGFYFQDPQNLPNPQTPHTSTVQRHGLHSLPALEEAIYDSEDPYIPLNYNFPATGNPPLAHAPASQSVHTSPVRHAHTASTAISEPPGTSHAASLSVLLNQAFFYPQNPSYGAVEPQYGQYAAPNPLLDLSIYLSFTFPRNSQAEPPKKSLLAAKHKNNLSISSHFNLFNIGDSASHVSQSLQPFPPQPLAAAADLLSKLLTVDGSNINNYLLTILYKLNLPLPVDDFYNLLYNDDPRPLSTISSSLRFPFGFLNKIDKTDVNSSVLASSVSFINQLLNVFKDPASLANYFPSVANPESKLSNINYHELLRTFLAIKILFDILILLPVNSSDVPQNYTIPRLSIYKTYYIICQKLILQYPSSSNTANEQQKLILGQSKLGKLIKMVYPNLMIKRLGSRGESKYNYLGVIWNENIVNNEIKELCDKNELNDLNEIFNGQRKQQHQQQHQFQELHDQLQQLPEVPNLHQRSHLHHTSHRRKSSQSGARKPKKTDNQMESVISPELSFIKTYSKFPSSPNFTILVSPSESPESNWFESVKSKVYGFLGTYNINPSDIQDILLNNNNLLEKSQLLTNVMQRIVQPTMAMISNDSPHDDEDYDDPHSNVDLHLYLIIIMELLPYLLLIRSNTEINFLKNLRLNMLHMINNFNSELLTVRETNNSDYFPNRNSTIFLLIAKKIINLNDLLITFIKLIIKDNSQNKSAMAVDIENFFMMDITAQPQPPIPTQLTEIQSRNSSIVSGESSVRSSVSSTTSTGKVEEQFLDSYNLNFKNILSNDLISTLIGYNFDPTMGHDMKSSISMNYINKEINLIDQFFKQDLLDFLSDNESDPVKVEPESLEQIQRESLILSSKELQKLNSLITLIDSKLLADNFKSKYPILIYNNYINFILNDLLKFIFWKQQQQLTSLTPSHDNKNSFGNWWVFNSFIQEYISLLGEIVGLNDLL